MGFNERNFQRAQENFQQLAQQLNEFTQWALEELKKRDLELKETHIHLQMAKKQIDLLVGELADAKREIEELKERLAESGQVIAMPTAEVLVPDAKPEETYDELLHRASLIQAQMTGETELEQQAKMTESLAAMPDIPEPAIQEQISMESEAQAETASAMEPEIHAHRAFAMDLEHTGPATEVDSVKEHTFVGKEMNVAAREKAAFAMELDMGLETETKEPSLVEEPDPNFFAPAIAAVDRGDRAEAVRFLNQYESDWQAGDAKTIHAYFDFMDQLILSAPGHELTVRPALVQMLRFAVGKGQFDAVRTFIQLNNGSFESLILKEQVNTKVFMDLSVLYFQLMMKYEFKRWIRINRDENRLQNFAFQEPDLWNLLYMSLFFDQDEVIKEEVMAMKAKILRPIPEAKLYRKYVNAIREERNIYEAIEQFDDRIAFMRYVDEPIRDRVFPMMKERLNAKSEAVKLQVEAPVEEEPPAVEKKPEVAIEMEQPATKDLAKVEAVYLASGEGRACPMDETDMVYQEVSLRSFGSKQERDRNEGGEYKKVRLLYCPTCHRYYINQFIRWGIAGFIRIASPEAKEEHHIG